MDTQNAGRSEADIYDAKQMFEAWGQAWRASTQGIMVASVEQLELTKALNSRVFDMMEKISQPCSPQEIAEHWLDFMRPSFEAAVQGYRRINDELARSFFAAAEGFTYTPPSAAASPAPVVKPPAKPIKTALVAAPEPVKPPVVVAAEPVRKSA
jgi:hypothetical protein